MWPRLEVLEDRTVPTVLDVNTSVTFDTIQGAVNAASAGDTLQVGAGVYQENVTINKSLTLLGPNAGINPNTGIRGPEAIVEPSTPDAANGKLFLIEANNVTIEGLTIDGQNNAAAGITNVADIPHLTSTVVSGLTVENDIIENLTYAGILGLDNGTTPSSGNVFLNNKIDNIPPTPTALDNSGFGILVGNNFYAAIEGNTLTRVGTGIEHYNNNMANPGSAAVIDGNTITFYYRGIFVNFQQADASPLSITENNLTYLPLAATANHNDGVFVATVLDGVSVTILNNNVTGAQNGVELWNDPTKSTITVQGGTLTNNQVGVLATNHDVNYGDSAAMTAIVNGVTITGSTSDGVLIASNDGPKTIGLTVEESTIQSGAIGVEVRGGLATFVLDADAIYGNQTGVLLDDDVTATSADHVNGSAFGGNTIAGLVHDGHGILDATNDWWGSPTGPTHPNNPDGVGQLIKDTFNNAADAGVVNFKPFLTTNPLPAAVTTTAAANATALYSASAQDVTLTAQVKSIAGPVNEGTVTFTIKQGSTVIGTAVESGTVSNGQASVTYVLPAGTVPGTYTIDAVYNPGPDFTTSSDNTHTLTVSGIVAPTVNMVLPDSAQQGSPVTVTGSFTDPDGSQGNPYSYTWTVSGPGGFSKTLTDTIDYSGNPTSVQNFTFTPPDNGEYTVTLQVTGNLPGDSNSDTHTLSVGNVAPTVNIVTPSSAQEGSLVTATGAFTDPAGTLDQPYNYVWIAKNANGDTVAADSGTINYPSSGPAIVKNFTFTPTDNGIYTVTLQVTDTHGSSGSDTRTLPVGNVAPTVSIAPVTSVQAGNAVTAHGSFTDPAGAADVPYTFTWTATDSNGHVVQTQTGTITSYPASGAAPVPDFSFTPANPGNYTIQLVVADKNGVSNSASQTVTVSSAPPSPTPPQPSATFPLHVLAQMNLDVSSVPNFSTPDGTASLENMFWTAYSMAAGQSQQDAFSLVWDEFALTLDLFLAGGNPSLLVNNPNAIVTANAIHNNPLYHTLAGWAMANAEMARLLIH